MEDGTVCQHILDWGHGIAQTHLYLCLGSECCSCIHLNLAYFWHLLTTALTALLGLGAWAFQHKCYAAAALQARVIARRDRVGSRLCCYLSTMLHIYYLDIYNLLSRYLQSII